MTHPSRLRLHSGVGVHKFDRGQHCFLYSQPRPPTQSADARAVQQDKWTISHPAPLPARVSQLRMQTEMFTDPPNGVVNLAIFVRTKVEDVQLAIRFVDCSKNRVDAVLNVQVRFSLMAIAQHMKMFRMLGKLVIEIEYVSMRIAFPENRYKSKNVALHSEAFAVGLNQAFRSQFRSPVQRSLDRKGTSLGRRENIWLSIH